MTRRVGHSGGAVPSDGIPDHQEENPGRPPSTPESPQPATARSDRNHSTAAAGHAADDSLSISSYHSRPKTPETHDMDVDLSLPYRTLSRNADMSEYRTERTTGEIEGPPVAGDGQKHYHLVVFTPDDPGNPKNWTTARKWYCTIVVAVACFVVTFASSNVSADFAGVMEEFDVSEGLALASMALFVVGLGVGELISARAIALRASAKVFVTNRAPLPRQAPWHSHRCPRFMADGSSSKFGTLL